MKRRLTFVGLLVAVGLWMGPDLLACGDKFLVAGRKERVTRRGAEPQAAVRPLPVAIRMKVEPAGRGVADREQDIAPVVRDVENLLDE